MSTWDSYPPSYRSVEVKTILSAVQAGECVSVVGLSGAGKSNLMGFLARRAADGPAFALLDCNSLPSAEPAALFAALADALGGLPSPHPTLAALTALAGRRLDENPAGLCLLLDRFDPFNIPSPDNRAVAANLRALRDLYKYSLTYVISTRAPLDAGSEMAELFTANTLWLGPLSRADALWSLRHYAERRRAGWDDAALERLFTLSRGYPSLMRAAAEAHIAGVPLELEALRSAPAVRRRLDEFWADAPSPEALRLSGLEGHPLLERPADVKPPSLELTALEQRLLDYFSAHPDAVLAKDDLIRAVWPDETVAGGLRDDSLAQLVHRLRDKVGAGHIQTLPGRGYRYRA